MNYKLNELNKMKEKVKKNASKLMAESVAFMKKEALKNLSGNVSDSAVTITVSNDGMSAVIETNFPYAAFIEYGTSAHKIKPKNSKVLHFIIDGKDVFVKETEHPGTKPKPFFNKAFEETRQQLLKHYCL